MAMALAPLAADRAARCREIATGGGASAERGAFQPVARCIVAGGDGGDAAGVGGVAERRGEIAARSGALAERGALSTARLRRVSERGALRAGARRAVADG